MVGGIDNGRQKPGNHGYDVIAGGERLLITPITLANRYAKPKLKSTGAGRYQLLSAGGMPTASSLAWKTSPKSQDAVALQQIKERGALPMIDRGDIRQAIDRCSNIQLHRRALLRSFGAALDSLIAKFKEAAWTDEIDVWAESPRLSPLWLSASSSAVMAVNHYRDNAITYKAQRDKNARELKLANAAITDMQMRQRDVAALDAKYSEGVSRC